MKQLQHRGIGQQPLQARRLVIVRRELDQMGVAVAGRQLHQAQPVAMRVEPHRLGVDRDRRTEGEALRKIAMMQLMNSCRLRRPVT